MGTRQSYNIFLRNLIRDNCEHENDGYTLNVKDLLDIDKRLFLSYLIDLSDYEGIGLEALMLEYGHEMQDEIDSHIDEIYAEDEPNVLRELDPAAFGGSARVDLAAVEKLLAGKS